MVHLWFMEDFKVEGVVKVEALDEDEVRSYAIIMGKLDIMHEILKIPLALHVSIVDSLTM